MVFISANFSLKQNDAKCLCGQTEDMKHIYSCKYLNDENEKTSYEMIFTEDVNQQIKVYKRFKSNLEKREKYKNESKKLENDEKEEIPSHEIPVCDPLFSMFEYSNGNK